MRILKGRVNWADGWANEPRVEVLVDKMPDLADLRYEEREGLYYGEKDGYVSFYYYVRPGDGFGGRTFKVRMKDGSERDLKGPWSSRAGAMNRFGFGPCVDVSMTDNPESFERGYTFFSASCTLEVLMEAMDKIDIGPGYGFKKPRWAVTTEEFPFPEGSRFDLEEHDDGEYIVYIPAVRLPDGELWLKNPKKKRDSSYTDSRSSGEQMTLR